METVITVRDLKKTFKPKSRKGVEVKALDGISFEVSRGEFFGLLGPNGAGKTTTIGILTTRVLPTAGVAQIEGIDVARDPVSVKHRIGVVPQVNNLDRALTAKEILLFHAEYFGVPKQEREERAHRLLERFELTERADEKITGWSGGMAQRLKIGRALMHDPAILFLDEPTTGLDPQARHAVWERLRELKRIGVAMLLTTHYMEEAAQLCDRLVIMDHGRIIAAGTPRDLVAEHVGHDVLEIATAGDRATQAWVEALCRPLGRVETIGDHVILYVNGSSDARPAVAALAGEQFTHRRATLEDVFLTLTGRELRD